MVQEEFNIRPLSRSLRKKAETELNETPERIATSLKILHDWVKTHPLLQRLKLNSQWLIAFLRGCKYDIEKAKKKLDMFYTYKSTMPDIFGNRDPLDPKIQKILELGVLLPLRKTASEDAPRICISRVGPISSAKINLVDLIKVSFMILEIMIMEDDHLTICGEDIVADLKDMSYGFIFQWTPTLAFRVMTCSEKALSLRIKSFHLMNPPYGLSAAVAVLKMFVNAKIKNRIFVHKKDTTVYEHISRSLLPEEYGGTEGTVQELTDYWKRKVESYREWFLETDSTFSSDDTK